MDRVVFSQQLKQFRLAQGISQYDLANALGIARTSLKNWELAVYTPPIEVLADIALYFHVSTDYLLGLDKRASIQVNLLSERTVNAISGLIRIMEDDICFINK